VSDQFDFDFMEQRDNFVFISLTADGSAEVVARARAREAAEAAEKADKKSPG
jgi:hypothetical protein